MKKLFLIFLLLYPLELTAQSVTGPKGVVHSPSFTFDNVVFVPLASFAKAYGLREAWDPKTGIASLESPAAKLYFRPGSASVLFNGRMIKMREPARMFNGQILIPFQSGLEILAPLSHSARSTNIQKPAIPATKSSFTVFLDPGHGGPDMGARGRRGLHEKDINLDIAKRVRDRLQARGLKVLMSRQKDEFVTLWRRAFLGRSLKPHLFISIHTNAARSRNVHGMEIFYYAGANAKQNGVFYKQNRDKSYRFARLVQQNMKKQVGNHARGVKGAKFFVLRNATCPAVLMEVGFITHAWEEKNLASAPYRDKIAQAIVQSILDFKSQAK